MKLADCEQYIIRSGAAFDPEIFQGIDRTSRHALQKKTLAGIKIMI